jgi:Protein of unknown function (DUF1573)
VKSSVRTVAVLATLASVLPACGPASKVTTDGHKFPLTVKPSTLDMGSIVSGEFGSAILEITNVTSAELTIAKIESSCPCVGVTPIPLRVAPGSACQGKVRFDSTEEPSFRGSLSVELVGKAKDGAILFQTSVKVKVVNMADNSSGSG